MSQFQSLRTAAFSVAVLLCALPTRAADSAVLDAQQQRVAVVETFAPAVVAIFGAEGAGGGSGVLISADGYALTNFHVTRGAGNFMKCGLNDGKLYDAVIVGIDPTGDVAMIKLLGRDDFPHAELGDSDTVEIGDWVYAAGNPFLLATDFQPTVTYGIVSGTHRYQYPAGTFLEYTDCIQVDASINPGNSGGPLFNAAGQVIGINGRISLEAGKGRGRVNVGAGYAISINQIKHFMDHLRSGRIVDHATLGAVVASLDDGSVVVSDILEESEAYRRGLRRGDEIVSFAGRPVRSVNQFKNILGIYPKGWELPLVYRRDGQRREIVVRLRPLHARSEMLPGESGRPQPMPPDRQPDDQPEKPGTPPKSPPLPHGKPEAPPPEEYKHLFVEKPGFANYHFNEVEQKRLLKRLEELGDYAKQTGPWTLSGKTKSGEPFSVTLADGRAEMTLGDKTFVQPFDDSQFAELPPNSGGLLMALHHLRLLLTGGREAFSEFYYLGSEPLDGTGERVDVLVVALTGVESRVYFSQQSGKLVGWDTRLAEDTDQSEVRIGQWGTFEGRRFPTGLLVRSGDRDFAELHITETKLTAGSRTPAGGEEEKK